MLQLRNTPDPECKLSPAQIIFGRPLRDAFGFVNRCPKFENSAIQSIWREAWSCKEDALRTRFAKSVEQLNNHARPLPELKTGERVFVQNQTGRHPNKWDRSGIVLENLGHDKYNVKVDGSGRITTRNRRFLRRYTLSTPPLSIDPVVHTTQTRSPLSPRCQVVDMPLQAVHYPIERPNSPSKTVSDTVPSNYYPEMESVPSMTPPTPQTEPSTTTNESMPQMPVLPIQPNTTMSDIVSPTIPPIESKSAIPPLRTSSRLKKQTKQYDASSGTWK